MNEIIKGSIFFLSFGLLYFIFTLFIEYFLRLKPLSRTILFWLFILVEFGLLLKFILIPLLKLIGFQKGISLNEASKLIGQHFKEVDDKLLNVLQLTENSDETDLLLASIEQKSKNLQPIPFKKAINFKSNINYIKYLSIPIIIWIVIFFTGNNSVFTQSLDRVVHHKVAYLPPAPFKFIVLNKSLRAVEGKPFILKVLTVGDVIPEGVKINFNKESYFLDNSNIDNFTYKFGYPESSIEFYLEANGVRSEIFNLDVIKTPKIIDFEMTLEFPSYTHKKNEIIKSTGNAVIPEGTNITWNINSKNTSKINFVTKNNAQNIPLIEALTDVGNDHYSMVKRIGSTTKYKIVSSNKNLKNYEELNYQLQVIKDEFPKIFVKSDIDSVSRGPVQFVGQLSDDYGLSKLQVYAKNLANNVVSIYNIEINNSDFEEFYYLFPKGLILDEGANYELHFEIFDNDIIHGRKKTRSRTFFYKNKTEEEINRELLLEQKENYENMQNSTKNAEELQKSLEEFSRKLKNKSSVDWNDKKKMDIFLERQRNYQKTMNKNSEKLLQNLEEMDKEVESTLEDKKQNLKKRIQESKELQQKEELLKELQQMAEKLRKEGLLEKIDRLSEQNKQEMRSLERILELTKRFYVEKKSSQIIEKLKELANEQDELLNNKNNTSDKQRNLNEKFDSIQKDFNELDKENKKLEQPFSFPDTESDQKLIEMDMKKAANELDNEHNLGEKNSDNMKKAKKNQRSASNRMKELSEKLKNNMMQMEMDNSEMNIKDLQQIVDNLLIFSFGQEELMLSFDDINSENAEYPDKLKKQQLLKEYFEHIDDSLYTLSLRMVRLSSKIQKDLTNAHYNLDKSLENISENRIQEGITNQHYTMIAANNLADLLSNMLESLKNKIPGSGKGKGKKGEELSLPDIIKKQSDLIQKLKEGSKQGKGEKGKSLEQMSGEQFEIYQRQNQLREELEKLIKREGLSGLQKNKVLKQMKDLEEMLLKKGLTREVFENMQNVNYELLKMERASFEQNSESQRKSQFNRNNFVKPIINTLVEDRLRYGQDEILIRKNLPLQPVYQNKVKLYFRENKE